MISKFIKQHFFKLLLIPHIAGAVGMLMPSSRGIFMSLTSVMLIFSFVLVFIEESKWTKNNVVPLILIFISGFAVEYIGVNYGYLFGDYQYGTVLGPKIGGVPVIIALNWAMLCIASRSLVNIVTSNRVFAALLAALAVTAYDVLLEPVAIKFSWWWWDTESVPIFNYACWFIFSFIFQLWFSKVSSSTGRSYWMIIVHAIFYLTLLLI